MDTTTTRVVAVRDVGPDAVAFDLETPDGFDARPGQFVKLTAAVDGEEESRFYTISSPDVADTFEVTVEVDPEGTLGPWLADREADDEIGVAGPFGNDYYEGERSVLLLAGGPGVGPAVGIAEAALGDGHDAAVVYLDPEPMHQDRLATLAEAGARVYLVADETAVADAVADCLSEDQQVFVYGFADFLDVATSAVEAAGGNAEGAKVENFG